MKIQRLDFDAFGPFTGRALNFDGEGLHIVYGPNEAGKSSALRGLKALLYGIDTRTLDNYLHANDKLRVSGSLQASDGKVLTFTRRKGRKNTLLSSDGSTLDDQLLTPFLQGVSPELFEMLFGIDHQALIRGGQEILEQRGEVGQALFSAALGSHTLHTVLRQLDDETDALFRPRGSTQTINAGIKSYTQLTKGMKECTLSSKEWEEKRRTLDRTTQGLDELQSVLAERKTELNRLSRIQRMLPKLARRRGLLQELTKLGEVEVLADDFSARRQKAVHKLETAHETTGRLTPRLTMFQEELEAQSINLELLAQEERIEDLHAQLGAHRKALKDRPNLEMERQILLRGADSILKEVRPDLSMADIEVLYPVVARRQAIVELGGEKALLRSAVKQADTRKRKTESRLKVTSRTYRELPEIEASDGLRRTIVAARRLGDIDTSSQTTRSDLKSLEQQCTDGLSRLLLWDGELNQVTGLGVPNGETINRFKNAYDDISQRQKRFEENQVENIDLKLDVTQKLEEIRRSGAVPLESDLITARGVRDEVWHLLRRQWDGGEDITAEAAQFQTEGLLPDVFEARLATTDELSDRLRREADRVHALASLQVQGEDLERQSSNLTEQLKACASETEKLDKDWQSEWTSCQIVPLTPREMRNWLEDLGKLRERVEQVNLDRQKLADLEQVREQQILQLQGELAAHGKKVTTDEELEPLLLACEDLVRQLDEVTQQRDALVV